MSSVRDSTRTALILNTSKASWSPGFGSNSSTRAVSTSRVFQLELTHRFTQKRGFSRFDLNHRQRQPWHRQLQWDGGRSSAGSDVHQLAGGCRHVTRCDEGLQNQPVDRLVWILQRGQVDLLIPARQQRVERRQLLSQVVGEKQARTRGAADKAGGEIAGRHPTKRIRKAPASVGGRLHAIDIGRQNRHRRRRHPGQARRLAERGRT